MKFRELVNRMEPSVDFYIAVANAEMDEREICLLDGDIFRKYKDFDWLLDKKIEKAEVDRGGIYVTISLEERDDGEEREEL